MQLIKYWLKYYFSKWLIRDKVSPAVQLSLAQLALQYKAILADGKQIDLSDTGFSIFSSLEEDGLLFYIISCLGIKNGRFVDIGSNDCINSNCANLAFNMGWSGLFIDGDERNSRIGKKLYAAHRLTQPYQNNFATAMVTPNNVNQLLEQKGFTGEIDFLSIDIDGDDYWIWQAIETISPKIVMIENHVEYGLNDVVVPIGAPKQLRQHHSDYHGASPVAMCKLATSKDYRLIGANRLGFNSIFLRNDTGVELFKEIAVADTLLHPDTIKSFSIFQQVQHLPFVPG
jgi:hypothetical protein